jgi:acyl carrier protein
MSESGTKPTELLQSVRSCLEAFVPEDTLRTLEDSAPLITGGILDSITLVELVGALETRCGIKIQTHEMSVDHFDCIRDIADLVRSKMEETS